jgi:hypothetical protein
MKILQKIESWLGNSTWFTTKLENLKLWITKFLDKWESIILEKYADSLINVSKLENKDKDIIKVIVKNHIKTSNISLVSKERVLPPKVLVGIVVSAAKKVLDGIGKLVSIQPMGGPVALIFNLEQTTSADTQGIVEGAGSRKTSFILTSTPVVAVSRKLQTAYSPVAVHDINKLHDVNFYQEIGKIIAEEVSHELTNEIIEKLYANGTPSSIAFPKTDSTTFKGFFTDFIDKLIDHITSESEKTAEVNGRGKANWMIVSPMVATWLQSSKTHKFTVNKDDKFSITSGLVYAGTLNDKIKVYAYLWDQNSNAPGEDKILLGYKGSEFDSDYVYAPYQLLNDVGTVLNPITYNNQSCFITRHGEKAYNESAFRAIKITDIA